MQKTIIKAPCVELENLDNLFVELTAKNCNLKCKHCYIDFDPYKKVKDYISVDKIKNALDDIKSVDVKYIYLTGAEPMIHPDFNTILRLCLKKTSVTVHTNGMSINDKKARFLRKVEDESDNEIVFKVSLDHFDELKNDNLRGRGTFRKAVYAVQSLVKYGFRPIITVSNYYHLDYSLIFDGFSKICQKFNFDLQPMNLHVVPFINKNSHEDICVKKIDEKKLDCANSRIFTEKGVYSCPMLSQDSRGKSGSSLLDFSKKVYLETSLCNQCINFGNKMFSNTWV